MSGNPCKSSSGPRAPSTSGEWSPACRARQSSFIRHDPACSRPAILRHTNAPGSAAQLASQHISCPRMPASSPVWQAEAEPELPRGRTNRQRGRSCDSSHFPSGRGLSRALLGRRGVSIRGGGSAPAGRLWVLVSSLNNGHTFRACINRERHLLSWFMCLLIDQCIKHSHTHTRNIGWPYLIWKGHGKCVVEHTGS